MMVSDGSYTCPATGLYHLDAQVFFQTLASTTILAIRGKNGTTTLTGTNGKPGDQILSVSDAKLLNAGDIVQLCNNGLRHCDNRKQPRIRHPNLA